MGRIFRKGKSPVPVHFQSAITDHQNVNNHEIDWEGAKILERESDWRMRKTKEAIRIRTEGAVMNRDQGTFLSGIYDPLFASLRKTGEKPRGSEPRVRSFHASSSDEVLSVKSSAKIKVSVVFYRKI